MSFRQEREEFDVRQIALYGRSLDGEGKAGCVSRTLTRLEENGRRILHCQYTAESSGQE